MRKCNYCEGTELCGVSKDNIPVCKKHFNEYLEGKMRIVKELLITPPRRSNENG